MPALLGQSVQGRIPSLPDLLEEGAKDIPAFFGHEPRRHHGLVVEAVVFQEIHQRPGASRFRVEGPEVHLFNTGQDDGPGAHGARLESDVELRSFETPALEVRRGLGDGQDFGMGRGVLQRFAEVVRFPDDPALVDNHAAHGYLALLEGAFGLTVGALHVAKVGVRHGFSCPVYLESTAVRSGAFKFVQFAPGLSIPDSVLSNFRH